MPLSDREAFTAKLEEVGEATVRQNLALGVYGTPSNLSDIKISFVVHWLKSKEDARASVFKNKRDAREEETLAVAREANDIARSASFAATAAAAAASDANIISRSNRRIAISAAVIAAIAAAAAIVPAVVAIMGAK